MTTIIYHDGTFAWDSQTTWQGRAMNGADKVFVNGAVTFGVAGASRTSGILQYMTVPSIRSYEPNFDIRRWIVRELVPAILTATKEVDAAEVKDYQANVESNIIIHVDGVVGYLSGNLSFVEDVTGYYGVGSGSPYALGALHAGATPKAAVETAIQFDLYSGGEVRTLEVAK